MINGTLEQFLDTGWYSEATLYYNEYLYWCEADSDPNTGLSHFWVNRWRAKNESNLFYHSITNKYGELEGFQNVFDITGKDLNYLKMEFLKANIFDGKPFWSVEKDIVWLDEGTDIEV